MIIFVTRERRNKVKFTYTYYLETVEDVCIFLASSSSIGA